jgi:hypothetical protein
MYQTAELVKCIPPEKNVLRHQMLVLRLLLKYDKKFGHF